jgi:hypothetical protein
MAVTVTYTYPVAGLVPPTALQTHDLVMATVIADADADTTATIIHNMGMPATAVPIVEITPLLTMAFISGWYVDAAASTADQTVLTKGIGAGSGDAGAQIIVSIRRPHSIGN